MPRSRASFDLAAIGADVLDTGVRILGDVVTGRQIRCVVPAGTRDRHRQRVKARSPSRSSSSPMITTCLAWRDRNQPRRGRLGNGFARQAAPTWSRLAAETDAVDGAVGGKPADQHRALIVAPLAVCRLSEKERPALVPRECRRDIASAPADAFRCLVDRLVDDEEQAGTRKREHVLVQIGVTAPVARRRVAVARQRRMQRSAIITHRLSQIGCGHGQDLNLRRRRRSGLRALPAPARGTRAWGSRTASSPSARSRPRRSDAAATRLRSL